MTVEQLIELVNQPFAEIVADVYKLQKLVSYYKELYGLEACVGCTGSKKNQKYLEYYNELKSNGVQTLSVIENAVFLFTDNRTAVPMEFGSSDYLKNSNMTTERAVAFLTENKKRIVLFTKFPEDWMRMVEEYKNGKAQDLVKVQTTFFENSTTDSKEMALPNAVKEVSEIKKSSAKRRK